MKITLLLCSVLMGCYMLFDGIHVLAKGKYFGPPQPGPWAGIFTRMGIDPFRLGPLFISFGILWLVFAVSLLTKQSPPFLYGIILSIATLWYLPAGTLLSVVVIAVLLFAKYKAG
ncbi:MAG: hypothetical protein QM731_15935 [Chitinophagaceae bacterium]